MAWQRYAIEGPRRILLAIQAAEAASKSMTSCFVWERVFMVLRVQVVWVVGHVYAWVIVSVVAAVFFIRDLRTLSVFRAFHNTFYLVLLIACILRDYSEVYLRDWFLCSLNTLCHW
jgi:hypothetical protein